MRRLTLGIAAAIALTVGDVAAAAPLPNLAASDAGILKTFRPDGTAAATLPTTSWWSIGDTRIAIDTGSGANDTVGVRDARTGVPRYTIAERLPPDRAAQGRGRVLAGPRPGARPAARLAVDPPRRRQHPQAPAARRRRGHACSRARSTARPGARWSRTATTPTCSYYDVWLRDRKTAKTRRLTTDHKSRWPSLRSDGAVVAYSRERGRLRRRRAGIRHRAADALDRQAPHADARLVRAHLPAARVAHERLDRQLPRPPHRRHVDVRPRPRHDDDRRAHGDPALQRRRLLGLAAPAPGRVRPQGRRRRGRRPQPRHGAGAAERVRARRWPATCGTSR